MALRIIIHQRLKPVQGHFVYVPLKEAQQGRRGTYLGYFFTISMLFTIAHGIFLAAFLFVLTHNGHSEIANLNPAELKQGCKWVLIILSLNFVVDLFSLKERSFEWLEKYGNRTIGRVLVVHMTLILGLAAVALTGATRALFAVFITFKTLCDLSSVFPQWNPKEPPVWLCRIMDKVPNAQKPGMKFADFWKAEDADKAARIIANEKPYKKKG
ncbi:DUF6498-containing protein [soil metagenome]